MVTDLGMSLQPVEIDGSRTRRELQLEDQLLVLRQENETLAERLGVQERLLRMVAHELRTPLTAAKLALQSHELGQIDVSGDDNRFFPPADDTSAATGHDHNYNDNSDLTNAIANGQRGAYWHILHQLRRGKI